jgi:hypothetical protein
MGGISHDDDGQELSPMLVGSNVEQFAQLLVRDCRDMFMVSSVSWNLLNEKLEHFGVEE